MRKSTAWAATGRPRGAGSRAAPRPVSPCTSCDSVNGRSSGAGPVRPAEELQHGQGVTGRLVQADVARHRGDAAKLQGGVTAAERDGERVVDAGVAVEYYLPWRRLRRWRRAHAAMPESRRS